MTASILTRSDFCVLTRAAKPGARWLCCLLAWSMVVPLLPGRVSAQAAEAPPEAVELYREGRALYQEGRYRDAIVRLKAALELDPASPNLMYNVARVNELLGNLDEAIEYYRRYLHTLEASERAERADIEATLQRLDGAREEVRAFATAQPRQLKDLRTATVDEPLGRADLAFWLSTGAGAAFLLGGGITGWLALQRENDYAQFVAGDRADGPLTARQDIADEANALALSADIMLGAGALALTASALLFFMRDPEPTDDSDGPPSPDPPAGKLEITLGAAVSPDRAGLILSGTM